VLLIARSFSHSLQATERYYELLNEVATKRKPAEMSLAVMFAPGPWAIFTMRGAVAGRLRPDPRNGAIFPVYRILALMLIPTSVILPPYCSAYCPRQEVDRLVGDSRQSGINPGEL